MDKHWEKDRDLIPVGNHDILDLLHGAGANANVPEPFAREIYLCDAIVEGTEEIEGLEEFDPFLHIGDKVSLFREPGRTEKNRMIRIENEDGVKLGYIDWRYAEIFSNLMDAGKLLSGRITFKAMDDGWMRCLIAVSMQD